MKYKKTLFAGITILILSILIGTIGTLWGVSDSFNSLRTNETAGIGAVGLGIERALIATIIGLTGTVVGLGLVVYSIYKTQTNK